MPFAPHLRLTGSGTFGPGTGVEQFSYGISIADLGDGIGSTTEDRFLDVKNDLVAFHSRQTSYIWNGCRLRMVKLASIGEDGRYTADPFIEEMDVGGAIVSGPPLYPFQVSWAVSLDTNRRGPTGRGRFYVPAPMAAITASGVVGNTEAEGMRDSVKTFVDAVNNAPGIDGNGPQVVVASSLGYNTDVARVRVGRVLDTMRSRRRSISEGYTPAVNIA